MVSPSARKVWMLIGVSEEYSCKAASPSTRKVWMLILEKLHCLMSWGVAFRKEGVDADKIFVTIS